MIFFFDIAATIATFQEHYGKWLDLTSENVNKYKK